MRIDFWTNLSTASRMLSERAQVRLETALDRFRHRLSSVRVRLIDENGARGGIDKRCQVQVVGARGLALVVTGRGHDASSLIDTVADRVGARVAKMFGRSHRRRDRDSYSGPGH
jgi:putative sigma-54 modulation protein